MGEIALQVSIGRGAGARWVLVAGAAALALGLLLGISPAAAQFVCDSTTPGGPDGATATGANSFACGTNARAVGAGSMAIGTTAGFGADPANFNNTAVGNFAGQSVTGNSNSTFGAFAGSNVTGNFNSASGFGAGGLVTGNNNSAFGASAGIAVTGNSNSAFGDQAGIDVTGSANNAFGLFTGRGVIGNLNSAFGVNAGNQVQGNDNAAFGTGAGTFVEGNDNFGFGRSAGNQVQGSSNAAFGTRAGANVTGNSNSAFGEAAGRWVEGSGNVAIGQNAGSGTSADPLVVSNTVAIGSNAVARADGAVAIGNGAEATRPNQVVLGTADYTYSTPGITSAASKAAQSAPTHIVTSNAGGDLAAYTPAELGLATGGDIVGLQSQINGLGRRDQELAEGIAISLALAQPILRGHQTFGLNVGWGNFDGSSALGVTAAGVVSQNALGPGSSVTLYGGVGAGTDNGMVAGRAGVSFGW